MSETNEVEPGQSFEQSTHLTAELEAILRDPDPWAALERIEQSPGTRHSFHAEELPNADAASAASYVSGIITDVGLPQPEEGQAYPEAVDLDSAEGNGMKHGEVYDRLRKEEYEPIVIEWGGETFEVMGMYSIVAGKPMLMVGTTQLSSESEGPAVGLGLNSAVAEGIAAELAKRLAASPQAGTQQINMTVELKSEDGLFHNISTADSPWAKWVS